MENEDATGPYIGYGYGYGIPTRFYVRTSPRIKERLHPFRPEEFQRRGRLGAPLN